MAHCSSSLLYTSVHHPDAHYVASHELLPVAESLSLHPRHGETHVEATDVVHAHIPPPYSLVHSLSHKCFSCGEGGVLLHRVPYAACGTLRSSYHCTSCVLSLNKKMYCVLCLEVIREGSSASSSLSPSPLAPSFLTCCRCQHRTHLDCALKISLPSLQGTGLTLCKDCHTRNNGSISQSMEPSSKRQKSSGFKRSKQTIVSACKVKLPVIDKESLTATKIVAAIAEREAHDAKRRARALAKVAVYAAAQAKVALDIAYQARQSNREEEVKHTVSSTSKDEGRRKDGTAAPTTKTSKGSKRRALSAIVASETLARGLANVNSTAVLLKQKKKRKPPRCDIGIAEADATAKATQNTNSLDYRSIAQRARTGTKRRKALSALGLQRPSKTRMVLKSKGSKSQRSASSSKGKLEAIVSQVLSLHKVCKMSSKASDKVRALGKPSAILEVGATDGLQGNACRTEVHALSVDTSDSDVALCHCKIAHDRSSLDTDTMCVINKPTRAPFETAVQERVKDRVGGDEGLGTEQEKELLNFMNKTILSGKTTTTRVKPQRSELRRMYSFGVKQGPFMLGLSTCTPSKVDPK